MMDFNINDLSLEDMGQWPTLVKVSVIVFLSLLLIGMGYWLFIKGNFEEYDALQVKEVSLKKEFERKQHEASNLQEYRNQMQKMQEHFGHMLEQLPTKNEMPGLLEDISKTGIASGLTFELFAPLPEVQHDFYIELPIKIVVIGNYHQFAIFLSRVAQMSRIVTLHDLMIQKIITDASKQHDDGLSGVKDMTGEHLSMEITAKIYRYRTQ